MKLLIYKLGLRFRAVRWAYYNLTHKWFWGIHTFVLESPITQNLHDNKEFQEAVDWVKDNIQDIFKVED